MVVTGTKSEDSARQAARKFAKSAARLGIPLRGQGPSRAKTRDQFSEAFGKIHPLLKQFKKEDVVVPAAVPSRDTAPPHALPNV
ncbi:hypothetical protein WJX84_001204 [Apatococcus fuscideae]|uniref:Uncharacterized protein n=1 Tax=Apatococcus fuscideae TaxID=2026836 RepID=A0AAW1T5S9_9CHLO